MYKVKLHVNYLDSWGPPNAHWLVPLDDKLERDGVSMGRYPAAFAKSASFQGKVLGFPLRAHAMLMFYRKDVFDELGLEAPGSWDDVKTLEVKVDRLQISTKNTNTTIEDELLLIPTMTRID